MKDQAKHYNDLLQMIKKLGEKIPETMHGLNSLHQASIADGALSSKIKELISLGIAITIRCDGSIAYHVNDALIAGASSDEIVETIAVAILMGGEPSVVSGCEAYEALQQFSVLEK